MPTLAGIYYAQFNEGRKDEPPVVLIHGAGSSHLAWPSEIRRLPGQRVLAVDLAGHGKSSGVAQQSIHAHTEQMVDFLAAMGLYQAVFVGHSMGGAIALDMAVRHPTHVAGLGLIATGAYLGIDPGFLENLSNPLTVSSALQFFAARAFGAQCSPGLIERCMLVMKATRTSVLYGDWRACAQFDLREEVPHIEAPAWVIAGSEDQLTPLAYAHFLADRIPAARLQTIAGAGHMVFLEQPARVAQGLMQFLTALSATRFATEREQLPVPTPAHIYQRKDVN
jgi:pimeloyl-ACP methyl ester carboxylesterase